MRVALTIACLSLLSLAFGFQFPYFGHLRSIALLAAKAPAPAPPSILPLDLPAPRVRREKKNKYAEFSKPVVGLEPLDSAMRRADEKAEKVKLANAVPSRGTTVPTLGASPKLVSRNSNAKPPLKSSNESVEAVAAAQTSKDIYQSVVPSDPFTFGYVQIGKLLGPHGVHGELKVQLETDFAETRLSPGSILYVKRPHRLAPRPVRVESGRRQAGNMFLVKLEQVKTRIGALAFKNFVLFVKREDRPTLGRDEYLVRDLVGLPCFIEGQTAPFGIVVGVVLPEDLCDSAELALLMHACLEVQKTGSSSSGNSSSSSQKNELCLLPLVPSIVTHVDVVAKRILVQPPEGLLDLVYEEKDKAVTLRGFLPSAVALSPLNRRLLEQSTIYVTGPL